MPRKYLTKNIIKLLVALGICLVLVYFNPRGFFNPIRNIFFGVAYPFQKTFYLTGRSISNSANFFASIGNLKNENEKLIKDNNALSAVVASLQDEKNENEILRDQLKLLPRDKFDLVGSFVIGQDPQGLNSWIMIDKGADSGIRSDMPVIVSDSIIMGKVSEVLAHTSKVSLLSDSQSVVNVVDVETGARGVLRGEYGLGILMDMVSQQDGLNKDDTIITSGLGGDIPRGLLVGKINEVKFSSDKLFQQAIITPRIKYSKQDTVFVIKN